MTNLCLDRSIVTLNVNGLTIDTLIKRQELAEWIKNCPNYVLSIGNSLQI